MDKLGVASSSVMVYVCSIVPREAFVGSDKVNITVSFGSSIVSEIILAIVIFYKVSPGAKVNVPLLKV